MHQDHCPCHQRGPRSQRPLRGPVLDEGPHVRQLPGRLRRREDQGEPPLVELEAGLALGSFLALELFEGREGRCEELEDDGGVDVGDDSVDVLVALGKGRRSEIER